MYTFEQVVHYLYTNIRYMFYLVTPEEAMRPDIKDVPRYVVEVSEALAKSFEMSSLVKR